jgi:hypothetical protein
MTPETHLQHPSVNIFLQAFSYKRSLTIVMQ